MTAKQSKDPAQELREARTTIRSLSGQLRACSQKREAAEHLAELETDARKKAITLVNLLDADLAYWKRRCETFHLYILARMAMERYCADQEDENNPVMGPEYDALYEQTRKAMADCMPFLIGDAQGASRGT